MPQFTIRLDCENRPGIVAAVATCLYDADFNILDSQQFDDLETNRFFARIVFEREAAIDEQGVKFLLQEVQESFGMNIVVHDHRIRRRVMLLVSKLDHCLVDLLYRWRTGELEMDVVGVISNHPQSALQHIDFGDIPFHHLPIDASSKPEQEAQLWEIVENSKADLVVLARYMQILSNDLSRKLSGKCINIHHSFLPSFKGAKPYHQAFTRGVKIIGATAHYVTSDLDEGPIIEQDVERVSHRDSPEQLVRRGRDIERRVLSRAVRYHLEDRVLMKGNKTIVFPE
ncbi:formyltetrahydrofolate deformylase [Pseudomonas putida]|uniref:Formyltetrahydrofolate deformylase n=1 Tax=Pseudomonas putida TaxID=303 RepID=A0A1L7NF84_PSEPU|nr:formyltetrahydrofolate deformylase [Pseudomonas putida]BAW24127.1 formyltetrahydrofolate deformylase [Pseudomonas putida]